MKFKCNVCNTYVYDSEKGDIVNEIDKGTLPQNFPSSWRCPICGSTHEKLNEISDKEFNESLDSYKETLEEEIKEKTKQGILIGTDNEETPQSIRQEYGKPLGLRGIGLGISYNNNFKALQKYKFKNRLISKHIEPKIETDFFGKKINMPILGAPMSGLSYVLPIEEEDFASIILEGCKNAGTIGFTGNTSKDYKVHPGIVSLKKVNGHGVNIFKPQSQEILKDLIKQSEKEGAIAVGIDIDGAGSVNFTLAGKPVFRKTIDEIRELKKSTKLPFIVKGIMNNKDALAVLEAGVDAIGISNHGGRVLDSTPGVAEVLPEIVKTIREKNKNVIIIADGGIRTGFDALKMLALGANFVLVGRPLAREIDKGPDGVKRVLDFFKEDLIKGMIMTSCNSLEDINKDILYKENDS